MINSIIIRTETDKLSVTDLRFSNPHLFKYQGLLILFPKYLSNLLFFNHYITILIQTTIISLTPK